MADQPLVPLTAPRGTRGRGRFGARPVRDERWPDAIRQAAQVLDRRQVPMTRIATFFVVPYHTVYYWCRRS